MPHHSTATATRRTVLITAGGLCPAAPALAATVAAEGPTVLPQPPSTPAAQLGFESRVEEFTLPNGMHFIVLPRRDVAPVVATHIFADVGAWEEVDGQTGLAHLLEHMAFKGTRRVGARDWAREAPLLNAMDEVFYEQRALRDAATAAGDAAPFAARAAALEDRLRQLQAQAAELVQPNAYGARLARAGAVGLNASTSHDNTRYYCSLPSNALELWFALESERFRAPVFRELYSEKRVIDEERRLRVDGSPLGRWEAEFSSLALPNNYRRSVIGSQEDFDRLGRREVVDFFARHYGPRQLTVALVGDVTGEQARRLADRYWSGWSNVALPPAWSQPAEGLIGGPYVPPLSAASVLPTLAHGSAADAGASRTRSYAAPSLGGPLVMLGYDRPSMVTADGPVIQSIADILTGSRTSRLTSSLVLQRRAVRSVRCLAAYPADKHPGLSLLVGVPKQGEGPEDAERLILQELNRFLDEGPGVEELSAVQRGTRTNVLASALSNGAMASLLASYHALTGSWRGLLDELEVVMDMRPDGVRSVAQRVFGSDKPFRGYAYSQTARTIASQSA